MPHPQHHLPVPQGHPLSTKCRLATGSPPEAHKQSQYNHTASTGSKDAQRLGSLSTTLPTQELTSIPVWVWQHHPTTVTPTSHLRSLSYLPHNASGVLCCSPLTPCHAHRSTRQGSKVTRDGIRPPHSHHTVESHSRALCHAQMEATEPTFTHIQQLHTSLGARPQA